MLCRRSDFGAWGTADQRTQKVMKVLHTNMLQSRTCTRGKQPGGCQRVPQHRRSAQKEEDKRTDQEFTIRDSNQRA